MSLSLFEFSGNSYEQGLAHGECLKEFIEKNIDIYISRFHLEAGVQKEELLSNTAIYLDVLRKQSPEYVSGINGIADGSNLGLLEISMLNLRYEMLYCALGKLYAEGAVDGCTSFALMPEATKNNHLIMGQNWDWIPEVDCILTTSTDTDGLKRMAFTEAGIFGGKPGLNSEGIGIAVNGMYSTDDDFSRFEKPFHLRCYEILRSKNMEESLGVLTGSPRSCTANFIIGHGPRRVVNIELAPDNLHLIDVDKGIISHANHIINPGMLGVSEPPNPRRHLSEFRQQRMKKLLNDTMPHDILNIQDILKDHENHPQSLCRHRDESLQKSQHTITKTAMIIDLVDKKIWATDGQPCKAEFEEFNLN